MLCICRWVCFPHEGSYVLSQSGAPVCLGDRGTTPGKWIQEVPRRTSRVPLVTFWKQTGFYYLPFRLPGASWDHFRFTVEPSLGHIWRKKGEPPVPVLQIHTWALGLQSVSVPLPCLISRCPFGDKAVSNVRMKLRQRCLLLQSMPFMCVSLCQGNVQQLAIHTAQNPLVCSKLPYTAP